MRIISRIFTLALALALAGLASLVAPTVAAAQDKPVLVELFTSQGCSSCPPADAFLGKIADTNGVIALAFHVDYWDYLGWKDTFARPAFTERQRSYAPKVDRSYIGRRLRGSFTPEMVIQGTDSLVGSSSAKILERIAAHGRTEQSATIDLRREGGNLRIALSAPQGPVARTQVMVARYRPKIEVAIERGENAGKSLTYHRVVTRLDKVGDWDGRGEDSLVVRGVDGPVVVFLQRGKAGPVLAVAELRR